MKYTNQDCNPYIDFKGRDTKIQFTVIIFMTHLCHRNTFIPLASQDVDHAIL